MDPTPNDSQAEKATCGPDAAADVPGPYSMDAVVRDRLRGALERELELATAAGDHAARGRLLVSLQSVIAGSR
jgi:hypothetical protein